MPIVRMPRTPPSPEGHAPSAETCPLCGEAKHMGKAKPLYDHMVCRKCYYSFANRRQLAFFLDAIAWRLIMVPVSIVMNASGVLQSDIQSGATTLDLLLLPIFFCKDCFSGHSLGKLICGVRTIDETTGEPGGIGASLKRNLPLIIPFMPIIVGLQLCKGHRTGDGWSNTKVIWKKYATNPIFAAGATAREGLTKRLNTTPQSGARFTADAGERRNMDRVFKMIVVCVLIGILGMLVAIYARIPNAPPTLGDIQKADGMARKNLMMQRPFVHVSGSVDVDGTVDVKGEVDVGNTPLKVEIER